MQGTENVGELDNGILESRGAESRSREAPQPRSFPNQVDQASMRRNGAFGVAIYPALGQEFFSSSRDFLFDPSFERQRRKRQIDVHPGIRWFYLKIA
jgi:hypothetical protein